MAARAKRQQVTRRRIIEAAIELHSTVGPAHTSLTAVADRAGVSRPTVYAYFPDAPSLFAACSQEATAADPWPDPHAWTSVQDPAERLRHALAELYAYYRRNEQLTANVLRDLDVLPDVPGRSMANTYEPMRVALAAGWNAAPRRRRLLRAAIHHALDFHAWRSLVRPSGLTDDEAVGLMAALVAAAAG
jgi:AcrR family transcriptional regulator